MEVSSSGGRIASAVDISYDLSFNYGLSTISFISSHIGRRLKEADLASFRLLTAPELIYSSPLLVDALR
jgi:hypothetical protein